jgi:hypothetical protein
VSDRPLPGEAESGDIHVVATRGRRTLLSAIDGLGHGSEAADAAVIACGVVEANAAEPLESLIAMCHKALYRTRGVVMTLAAVDHDRSDLEWVGVGNVEGARVRPRGDDRPLIDTVFHSPGVVGYRLPKLHLGRVTLEPGDLVVLATDGIDAGFLVELRPNPDVARMAEQILDGHARESDDALVLVARYDGVSGG